LEPVVQAVLGLLGLEVLVAILCFPQSHLLAVVMALVVVISKQMVETVVQVVEPHLSTPLEVSPEVLVTLHLYLHLRAVTEVTPHPQQVNLRLVVVEVLVLLVLQTLAVMEAMVVLERLRLFPVLL
jgi:hypothetical protein